MSKLSILKKLNHQRLVVKGCKRQTIHQLICLILFTIFFLGSFSSCSRLNDLQTHNSFTSYLEIPSVYQEEIDAINRLKEQGVSFKVSAPYSIELFLDENGKEHGYIVLLCEWLSSLFGIHFYPNIDDLGAIVNQLESGDASFGTQTITNDRKQRYFMTDTIAQRSVKILHLENSLPINIIIRSRPPRYAFLDGTMLVDLFAEINENGAYESIIAEDYETVYRMLQSGDVDALVGNNAMEVAFDPFGGVISEDFMPLTFIPVSLATGNQSLEPIISIVTKALRNGAYSHLTELYRRGYEEYKKHRFRMRLTEEEKAYIRDNPIIPFASQYMSYPVSFYNKNEDKWEGVVFDVIEKMEQLTGISFTLVNDTTSELLELMQMLENGTVYFIPNLIQSDERRARFVWPNTMYIKDKFALLSKQNYPNIEQNDIPFEKIGFARGSAFADIFRSWFPNAIDTREYPNTDEAFKALDTGEINLMMSSQSRLTSLTNYYEFSDYKANYLFSSAFESSFGVNKDHAIFCNIVDNALSLIDTDRILEQWSTKTYNYQAKKIKDQKMWIIFTSITVMVALGLVLCVLLIAYVNNQKKNKTILEQAAKLDSSNIRTEAIIQNLPGMVFQHLYNPPKFTCLFASMGCKELTGYEASEMLGEDGVKFFDFIHPNDTDIVEKLSAETLENDLPYENTFRILTRDGSEKWVWERSRVVEKNPDGTPYIIEGYHTDVTERMKLQQIELEQKKMLSRIEAIISNLPGMAFQCLGTFPDYPLTYVSKGSFELLGYKPEELVGGRNKYMDMLHHDDLADFEKKVFETLEVGLPFENVHRLILKDGTIKWVLESCVATEKNPDGSPAVIDGYVFDITKQRQYETAEMANRAKTEFLATMSHEIRTPMNSIMGFAELASDTDNLPQIRDYLGKITDSTSWLLRIINDILDISKIEAGKMELDYIPFNLHEVFTRCQSVILPPLKEKGLDLKIYAEPIIGRKLLGDPMRLYQVLMNLLSNAVKFTHSGSVKFLGVVKQESEGVATIFFEVADTGIGLSEQQIEKIFEPFIQADSSTTRNYGGSGLGLAIVKNIVELMGGTLSVESTLGTGSKFCFEVSFDTVESSDTHLEHTDMTIYEKPYFEGLVLVCDDNPMNQEVICEHLSRVGLRTQVASNGKIGVDMVHERILNEQEPFDLIFMDMFMPIMDGIEAATKIFEITSEIPIIAMTANIMTSEIEKYKKHGMPDCLGKPFTSQELWHVLLSYLTPVCNDLVGENENNDELQRKLKINFFKNNQTLHIQIKDAIDARDFKLAHRLAHSLKGNAGLIGKTKLKNIAEEIEEWLKNLTESSLEDKIDILKMELLLVLEELKPLYDESKAHTHPPVQDTTKVLDLFEKLEPLLEKINPEAAFMLEEIISIPGTEILVQQIENFDFESATKTLSELKAKWSKEL